MTCSRCNNTGVWETGNNDLPCPDCPAGDTALFHCAFVVGGKITGAEMKKHFMNDSPEPIWDTLSVNDIPGRTKIALPESWVNVLIVDDDGGNLNFVKRILEAQGHTTVVAYDGVEGLEKFQEKENGFFDVVLSDWQMPNMTGTEMVKRIRHLAPDQKIVMMSSDPKQVVQILKNIGLTDIPVMDKWKFYDAKFDLAEIIGKVLEDSSAV